MQVREALLALREIAPVLRQVSLKDVVEITSGHQLYPIDLDQSEDKELIDNLTASCKSFLALCSRNKRRFYGARINEVSKSIENEFVAEIPKTGLKTRILSAQGYPDIELVDRYGRATYLEIKVSSKETLSSFRTFYYSSEKKVEQDARHLLLGIHIVEERDKYWRIEDWTLTDLSKLIVHLKSEFNASNVDIYDEQSIIARSKT